MALEQKLSVRMSQRLIMTPSLQQAIKLLQMSKLELVDEIQQELTENPVLEEAPEEPRDPFDDIDYESYFQDVEGSFVPRGPVETGEEFPSFESTLAKTPNLA